MAAEIFPPRARKYRAPAEPRVALPLDGRKENATRPTTKRPDDWQERQRSAGASPIVCRYATEPGVSTHGRDGPRTDLRREATIEKKRPPHPVQSSLRDERKHGGYPKPWVETHGYRHNVATRRSQGAGGMSPCEEPSATVWRPSSTRRQSNKESSFGPAGCSRPVLWLAGYGRSHPSASRVRWAANSPPWMQSGRPTPW